MWLGETPKNVAAVFRTARDENAVLFFDEADAIASRRSTSVEQGVQREMNTVVNVLLQEMERFNGVVIFATNMASNFDPAFERRIRTHVLFEMPGVAERERIWQVQFARQTPLDADVDFAKLARTYESTGGDIRNAVLKAALAAAAEPGEDAAKRITHRHLDEAMRDVLAGKRVMRQSILRDAGITAGGPLDVLGSVESRLQRLLMIASLLGGSALIVAIVALVVALLR
jgi:SpoVK/Ycf46/Vps4 family AAA+-type ATPase